MGEWFFLFAQEEASALSAFGVNPLSPIHLSFTSVSWQISLRL